MADQVVEEFKYAICGRTMRFRYPHGGQLIMLQRMRQRCLRFLEQVKDQPEDGKVPLEHLKEVSALNLLTLELIERLFVDPNDLHFIEQKMLEGVIDLPDLMPILAGGKTVAQLQDDEDPGKPVQAPASLKTKKPAATAKVAKKATRRAR